MKKLIYPCKARFSWLMILTFILSSSLFAGDVKIHMVYAKQWAILNTAYSAKVEYKNDEAFDVNDFAVKFSIYQLTGPGSWELKYEHEKNAMTVKADSGLHVDNTDNPWIPDFVGRYQLRINTTASNDINPDNDDITLDFSVNRFVNMRITQQNMLSPDFGMYSDWGRISFKIPAKPDFSYYNVLGKNPITGTENWIVRNLQIPVLTTPCPARLGIRIKFSSFGFTPGNKVDFLRVIPYESAEPISGFPVMPEEGYITRQVTGSDLDIRLGIIHKFKKKSAVIMPDATQSALSKTAEPEYYSVINEMVGDNLNNAANPPSDTYAGDYGASGLHSVAMGLHWLDRLSEDISLESDTTVRKILEALSALSERKDESGVEPDTIIKALLAYIDGNMLPVRVGFQSYWIDDAQIDSPIPDYGHSAINDQAEEDGIPPAWDYIFSGMKDGCAVATQVGWHDDEMNHMGNFWVPVVYASQSDTTRSLIIREDAYEPDTARAIAYTFFNYMEDGNWGHVSSFDDPPWKAYIEGVIVQCYDSTVSYEIGAIPEVNALNLHDLAIHRNPAPWTEEIRLSFNLDRTEDAEIILINIHGKVVHRADLKHMQPGVHKHHIPAGVTGASGHYMVALKTGKGISVAKLVRY